MWLIDVMFLFLLLLSYLLTDFIYCKHLFKIVIIQHC